MSNDKPSSPTVTIEAARVLGQSTTSPKTPNRTALADVQGKNPSTVALEGAHVSMPSPMAWMPAYAPYGYPYVGAPMTPQAAPGMVYGGYMGPHYYGTMYDMFGNLIVSPTPMLSPYPPSQALDEEIDGPEGRKGSH